MPTRNIWMGSEACEVLVRAERQYRQLFQLRCSMTRGPVWEPPVDVLETEREVLVFVALPGVDKDNVQAGIEGGDLVIAGDSVLPPELGSAVIHRLELPRGRFERRVPLPRGRFSDLRRAMRSSCLIIALTKTTCPKSSARLPTSSPGGLRKKRKYRRGGLQPPSV